MGIKSTSPFHHAPKLNYRQTREAVRLLAQGMAPMDAAEDLGVSPKLVWAVKLRYDRGEIQPPGQLAPPPYRTGYRWGAGE